MFECNISRRDSGYLLDAIRPKDSRTIGVSCILLTPLDIYTLILPTERDISRRCKETWESHPAYLRYTPQTDHDNVLIVYMLILAYLAYLYNEFLIQRLLVRQHQAPNTSLLSVSSQIISTVLLLARDRGLMRNIYVVLTSSVSVMAL